MVEKSMGHVSYLINSLGWFASWGCVQRIGQSLVFLHCLVFNLLGERQSLSIPHKISFLEYYSFDARIGVSIALQGIHELLPWLFCTFWKINISFTINPSTTSSLATMAMTTATKVTSTYLFSVATMAPSTTASGIELWNPRLFGDHRARCMN